MVAVECDATMGRELSRIGEDKGELDVGSCGPADVGVTFA